MQKLTPPRENNLYAARSQILRRCEKVSWQFVIEGQTPGFHVQVAASLALQGPRLLKIA